MSLEKRFKDKKSSSNSCRLLQIAFSYELEDKPSKEVVISVKYNSFVKTAALVALSLALALESAYLINVSKAYFFDEPVYSYTCLNDK